MPLDQLSERFRRKQSGTQYRTLLQVLHIDIVLLLSVVLLMTVGLFILYSASNQNSAIFSQGIMHIGLALLIMIVLAQLSPITYARWSLSLFIVSLLLLALVLVIGHIDKGAQRWLNFGLFRFQPSELMKLSLPMMLAWYYQTSNLPPKFKEICIGILLTLLPALLTLKEPDLGTAIILLIAGGGILLFAGIQWRYILGTTFVAAVSAPFLWRAMHDYQKQRILTFLNPARDPLGTGYHIIQSKIAIGSGGIFGKGWLQGTQSHLHFLPAHATDFIFAVFGEEFGFIGSVILLLIYLAIVARCIYITSQAQTTYTRLLAGTLTLILFTSVFINIGMVCGILPVVGLPLPLVSYGGSSMVITLASLGLLMSIHGHQQLLSH
ncbi:MAG: rod shape-determining protein RodA [Pseudomonadota bacterium]